MSDNKVRTRILRAATTMHNACVKSYKEDKCVGCPFTVVMGCNLYDHPVEWQDKLKKAKEATKCK